MTIWTLIAGVIVMMGVGFVIDAGMLMATKVETFQVAQQAARAGADELDTDSLRTGGSDVNPGAAASTARAFMASAGVSGTVRVSGDLVTVTATKTHRPALLARLGVGSKTASSTRTARSIDGPEGGPN